MGLFKKYFFNKDEITPKELSIAKAGFIVNTSVEGVSSNMLAGTYKVGLLALLGATEAESSFILSLATVAGFFQILIPLIAKKVLHKKPLAVLFKLFTTSLMGLIFLMPLIFGCNRSVVAIVAVVSFLSYIFSSLSSPLTSEWMMKCLSKGKGNGKYNALRIAVLYIIIFLTSFFAARIMEIHQGESEIYGYMWLAVIALLAWAVQIIVLSFLKEPYSPETSVPSGNGLFKTLKEMLKNEQMRPYIRFNIIHYIGYHSMVSLPSIMCVQRFGMSMSLISYISICGYVIRIIATRFAGKAVDRFGGKIVSSIGYMFLAASYIIYAFMTKENCVPLRICVEVFFALAWAILDVSSIMFQMEFIPEKNRASYIACSSTLFSLIAIAASWLTTFIISFANGFKIKLFGMDFSEMNIIFAVGSIFIFIASMTLFFTKKKKVN